MDVGGRASGARKLNRTQAKGQCRNIENKPNPRSHLTPNIELNTMHGNSEMINPSMDARGLNYKEICPCMRCQAQDTVIQYWTTNHILDKSDDSGQVQRLQSESSTQLCQNHWKVRRPGVKPAPALRAPPWAKPHTWGMLSCWICLKWSLR